MPSDVFQGILSGLGSKYQEHHANILSMEQDRRKQLGSFLATEMHNPNRTPESQQELQKQWLTLNATPAHKPLHKSFDADVLRSVSSFKTDPGTPSAPEQTLEAPTMPGTSIKSGPDITLQAPTIPDRLPAMYTPEQQSNMASNAARSKVEAEESARSPYRIAETEAAAAAQERHRAPATPQALHNVGAGEIAVDPTGKTVATGTAPAVPRDPKTGATIITDEGNKQWNPETQRYDIDAGKRPPTAAASAFILPPISYADLDPKTKARVDAVRDKVATGQYTPSQGLNAVGGVRGGLGGALTESLGDKLVLPVAIRNQNTDIERARNLLTPIHELVDEINKTPDLAAKAVLSGRLEQYVQSIGTQFARAKGERGVVTDRDVSRVLGLLPGWKSANFAPKYAADNLKIIEDTFDRDQNALMKGYFSTYDKGGAPTPPSAGGPKVGTIEDGHVFLGGNPADPNNWKPQ